MCIISMQEDTLGVHRYLEEGHAHIAGGVRWHGDMSSTSTHLWLSAATAGPA